MPRGDRTGPDGQGPVTGRGAGYCTGNNQPGYSSSNRPLNRNKGKSQNIPGGTRSGRGGGLGRRGTRGGSGRGRRR